MAKRGTTLSAKKGTSRHSPKTKKRIAAKLARIKARKAKKNRRK